MLKILIEKEFKEIINSRKFFYSAIVCSLLVVLTFYVGAQNYNVSRDRYEASVAENIRSMKGITDWRMAKHKIFLPPQPLSYLVAGVSNDLGRNIDMEGRGELRAHDSRYNEEPIYATFRFLDLNFLFQVILSLFAILFSYNAINGEREQGTLKLTFSNSIPRDKYILAKIIGPYFALVVPITLSVLVGALIFTFLGVPLNIDDWLKVSLIIVTGFLFLGVYLSLSVFVSASTKKSSNSFLILLVIWIFSILIIPRTAVLIAGRAVDVPSVDEINAQKSRYNRQLGKELFDKMSAFKPGSTETMMEEFNQFMEKINKDRDDKMNEFSGKLNEQRLNRQIVQENLAFNIARVSPATSFSFAISELAGSSVELQREYERQAKEYQKIYAGFQLDKSGGTSGGGLRMIMRTEGEDVREIDPSELPEFKFQERKISDSLNAAIIDIGLLSFFIIMFFAGSFIKFNTYDVR